MSSDNLSFKGISKTDAQSYLLIGLAPLTPQIILNNVEFFIHNPTLVLEVNDCPRSVQISSIDDKEIIATLVNHQDEVSEDPEIKYILRTDSAVDHSSAFIGKRVVTGFPDSSILVKIYGINPNI